MSPIVRSYSVQKQVEDNFLPTFVLKMNGKQQVFATAQFMGLMRDREIPKVWLQKIFNGEQEEEFIKWLSKFIAESLIDMGEEFLEKMK